MTQSHEYLLIHAFWSPYLFIIRGPGVLVVQIRLGIEVVVTDRDPFETDYPSEVTIHVGALSGRRDVGEG